MNKALSVLPLFLLSTACTQQLYEGSALEDAQVTRIETRGVDLRSVDGIPVEGGSRTVEVLPGRHVVEAEVVSNSPMSQPRTLSLMTEAGRTYYLAGASTMPNCIRIQNEQGTVVAETKKDCDTVMFKSTRAPVPAQQ